MKTQFMTLCLSSIIIGVSPMAHAQMTLDVAKITCENFLSGQVSDSRTITIWLSGYYNGTIKNTTVDINALRDRSSELADYCFSHRSANLVDAVTTKFGSEK